MPRNPLIESSPRPISEETEQRIYDALFAGSKIQAIKEHRTATGAGLAESKELIDALERQLRAESPEKFIATKRLGCSGVIALTIGMGLAAATLL
jgi:hypothetical protein